MKHLSRLRQGFTLIEMLVVLAIIGILAGLLIAGLGSYIRTARVRVSTQRMHHIADALRACTAFDGSVTLALQEQAGLGGALRFARLPEVYNRVRMDGGGDTPGQRNHGGNPGGQPDPTDPDRARFFPPPFFGGGQHFDYLFNPVPVYSTWRYLEVDAASVWANILEVLPPATGPIPGDYGPMNNRGILASHYRHNDILSDNWYHRHWPHRWPRTNWNQDEPGDDPPILRFPWGSPGLRIDGSPVDPAVSHDSVVNYFDARFLRSGFHHDEQHPATHLIISERRYNRWRLAVHNRWAVFGHIRYNNGQIIPLTGEYPYIEDQEDAVYHQRSDGSDATVVPNQPEPFDVGLMSPLRTIALLQVAGILAADEEGAEQYRHDRSPQAPWNDQWGHPLVVAFALFQPERYLTIGRGDSLRMTRATRYRGLMIEKAREHFGYNRALYIVVGSIGPEIPEEARWPNYPEAWEPADDAQVLRTLWLQIRANCRAHEWTEEVQAGTVRLSDWSPGGVRHGRVGQMHSLLTAPVMIQ